MRSSFRRFVSLLALFTAAGGCGDPCEEPGTICTVAGVPGQLGHVGDGLPADETALYFPTSLDWSPEGRLVVVDFNNMRIRELTDDGRLVTIMGNGIHGWAALGEDALQSPLENPVDADFLPDGRLVVSELHTGRILVLEDDGTVGVLAGSGELGFDGDGGPATEAELSESGGVATGDDGSLYIADTDNHAVRHVDPDGVIRTVAGDGTAGFDDGEASRLRRPQAVQVTDEAIVIADTDNHAIRRLELSTGVVHTLAGTGTEGFSGDGGPADQAQLSEPYGLRVLDDGTIYVADSGNHRVRRIAPDGTITTVAGTGQPGNDGDGGPAEQAQLSFPADVLVGEDGAIWIADMRNGTVRRITPEGP